MIRISNFVKLLLAVCDDKRGQNVSRNVAMLYEKHELGVSNYELENFATQPETSEATRYLTATCHLNASI